MKNEPPKTEGFFHYKVFVYLTISYLNFWNRFGIRLLKNI